MKPKINAKERHDYENKQICVVFTDYIPRN